MNRVLSTWFNRYLSHPEAVTILVIIGASLLFFKTMGNVLAPVIISIIFSYLLSGLVERLKKIRFPHLLAVSIVFVLFIFLLLLLFFWLLPLLWEQALGFLNELPTVIKKAQLSLIDMQKQFPDLVSAEQLQDLVSQIISYLANFSRELLSLSITSLVGAVSLIVYLILVPFLIFFFLRDGESLSKWFVGFLPKKRDVLKRVWFEVHDKIDRYIQGKLLEILIVAVVTIIAFEILKLPYAILLGALVGLSVLIPYIGVTVVTVPVTIVGLASWGWSEHFFYLMLVYTVICVLDANLLVPMLFSEVMNLHPLAIILSVLFFGGLFGFWGIFFAIPLMTLFNVVISSWPKTAD